MYDAINEVRDRAGQPGLPEGLSKDEMRIRIHNERRVELCLEEMCIRDSPLPMKYIT